MPSPDKSPYRDMASGPKRVALAVAQTRQEAPYMEMIWQAANDRFGRVREQGELLLGIAAGRRGLG
jgi:hypothetical protein